MWFTDDVIFQFTQMTSSHFSTYFFAFWKFESDITHGSTFLYILWVIYATFLDRSSYVDSGARFAVTDKQGKTSGPSEPTIISLLP
jgi:hypothetical protein